MRVEVDILWAKQTDMAADLLPSFNILLDNTVLLALKAAEPPLPKPPDIIV